MILYVNGDSHAAAAEAANPYVFAEDDPDLYHLGRTPHPDNLAVSWGRVLSDSMAATLVCDAESASSNDRILRTTKAWIDQNRDHWPDTMMIIQWSTWERQEWLIQSTWYQVNASGIDYVPDGHQEKYRQFIIDINWEACTQEWHQQIWQFHQYLLGIGIRHVFFNGNSHFAAVRDRQNWESNYLDPYDPSSTFEEILAKKGFQHVSSNSWHFGPDAHCFWAGYMLKYINDNFLGSMT